MSGFKITKGKGIIRDLGSIQTTASRESKAEMRNILATWKQESTTLAPKDTGLLRGNIKTRLRDNSSELTGEITTVAKRRWRGHRRYFNYAWYIHEVRGHIPFKRPTTPGTIPDFFDRPIKTKGKRWVDEIPRRIVRYARRRGF